MFGIMIVYTQAETEQEITKILVSQSQNQPKNLDNNEIKK